VRTTIAYQLMRPGGVQQVKKQEMSEHHKKPTASEALYSAPTLPIIFATRSCMILPEMKGLSKFVASFMMNHYTCRSIGEFRRVRPSFLSSSFSEWKSETNTNFNAK